MAKSKPVKIKSHSRNARGPKPGPRVKVKTHARATPDRSHLRGRKLKRRK